MTDVPDYYQNHLTSLGRLCTVWAKVDREINHLLAAMLKITDEQVACIAHELDGVAARCRLIKTVALTFDNDREWRLALETLVNIISSDLGPKRNRYVHDLWIDRDEKMLKVDRRVHVGKAASFTDKLLSFDIESNVYYDQVDTVTIQLILAAAELAKGRFDLEGRTPDGPPPRVPQLRLHRVLRIQEVVLPADGN